jgi:biopolymer transport protein ExbD
MKIGNPHPPRRARIEIIPLIDIMFFLLASFLMASLSMIRLQSIKMDLPSAATARKDFKPDIINISVDKSGDVYLEKKRVELAELHAYLSNKVRVNTNVPVFVSGDKDTLNGMITRVLAAMREEGIQKVSFAIAPAGAGDRQEH